MTAIELLEDLKKRGVDLEPEGDSLRYRAPAGALTPALRQALAAHKAEVLAHLRGDLPAAVADWPADWREVFEERAAIMEYDGGLPRPEAEARAEELVREAHRRSQERTGMSAALKLPTTAQSVAAAQRRDLLRRLEGAA
jgi:hypothetical protein